jgi:hypothetical protein
MVASCGGEKVAQRTGLGAEGSILQKTLWLGEKKPPYAVGVGWGAVTVTVAVASAFSV